MRYDLVVGVLRLPPKAIVGLAAERRSGAFSRFSGGEEGANRLLRELGFTVLEKAEADRMGDPQDERDRYGRWQLSEPVEGTEVLYHPSIRRWSFRLPQEADRRYLSSWGEAERAIRSPEAPAPHSEPMGGQPPAGPAQRPWSSDEVRAAADAYFGMLLKEQAGEAFVKAEVNRELRTKLAGRNRQAVDYKFANISAILHEELISPLNSLVPRTNIKHELRAGVLDVLDGPAMLRARLAPLRLDVLPPETPQGVATSDVLIEPPRRSRSRATRASSVARSDWVGAAADEARRDLGRRGEEWVCERERAELAKRGRPDLAGAVGHVAVTVGDGLGYDVLSFDPATGSEVWIEVKTTNRGASAPFLVSEHELQVWRDNVELFRLYRVCRFSTEPRLYVLTGDPDAELETRAVAYSAWPRYRSDDS